MLKIPAYLRIINNSRKKDAKLIIEISKYSRYSCFSSVVKICEDSQKVSFIREGFEINRKKEIQNFFEEEIKACMCLDPGILNERKSENFVVSFLKYLREFRDSDYSEEEFLEIEEICNFVFKEVKAMEIIRLLKKPVGDNKLNSYENSSTIDSMTATELGFISSAFNPSCEISPFTPIQNFILNPEIFKNFDITENDIKQYNIIQEYESEDSEDF